MQKRISSRKMIELLVDRLINGEVLDLTDKLDYYFSRQKILNGILWGEMKLGGEDILEKAILIF